MKSDRERPGSHERWGWDILRPGMSLTIVKLSPDGTEVARYPGDIVAVSPPDLWIVVHAVWTYRQVELDGLVFSPGDQLLEWFSPAHWCNAFAVIAPDGALKGWYANVTYPASLDVREDPPILTWHDLYLDLVGLPDGSRAILDEDELQDSDLAASNPVLDKRIRDEITRLSVRFDQMRPPFAPAETLGKLLAERPNITSRPPK